MLEFPSIINSSKAPRKHCIAFDKLDGSNFRAKYTQKQGFCLYGTRTQLIDETTPFWSEMVQVFKRDLLEPLTDLFRRHKELRNFREITVFMKKDWNKVANGCWLMVNPWSKNPLVILFVGFSVMW